MCAGTLLLHMYVHKVNYMYNCAVAEAAAAMNPIRHQSVIVSLYIRGGFSAL